MFGGGLLPPNAGLAQLGHEIGKLELARAFLPMGVPEHHAQLPQSDIGAVFAEPVEFLEEHQLDQIALRRDVRELAGEASERDADPQEGSPLRTLAEFFSSSSTAAAVIPDRRRAASAMRLMAPAFLRARISYS